ncbi:Glutamyl-tRNA amidotransferase subunit C [Limosilactobacillus gastricus PS3]|uniref:Aspartyl/glutamyl-tRNA(Asn/Gln) amidotransferase subunit C n=1 Tax=Limosilactobacillus gastricus PS3 TaxID=1144300 RepID=H4GK60_9LACO|nr:Asp-tRNA(Asn)/Glu-tRNA(Gln) amidotransferase subunit GatC [Limosilactobacillus gastricus]EHS85694.1 Glutamyl-tRNA amidotransferase subunit C [Limosilactobacillus gastricus PS3]
MAENLDREQVQHVAELAKLSFTDAELDHFVPQLEEIIDLFNQLAEVDTEQVKPMTTATDEVNVLREDEAVKSSEAMRQALLANAPETEDGLIRVPAILDESEDGE